LKLIKSLKKMWTLFLFCFVFTFFVFAKTRLFSCAMSTGILADRLTDSYRRPAAGRSSSIGRTVPGIHGQLRSMGSTDRIHRSGGSAAAVSIVILSDD
jgi:hypothetical protein